MNKLLTVFWDVDGTIADTELSGHRVAFNLSFADYDLDWIWDQKVYIDLLKISGGLNRIIYYRDLIGANISNKICSRIQHRKRFHYKNLVQSGNINPREGVIRLIEDLGRNDVAQYIVTTSGIESLEPLLESTLKSSLKYFSGKITYEDVDKHKPFPDAYNLALSLCNQPSENCLAIEDSCIGVQAAKAANLDCLMTLTPWGYTDENILNIANACVDTLGSITNPSNVIKGRKLFSSYVNHEYLSSLINK